MKHFKVVPRAALGELNEIIFRMISYHPRDRYRTANEVIEALESWKRHAAA